MPYHIWLSEVPSGVSYMDALHQDFAKTLTHLSSSGDCDFRNEFQLMINKAELVFRTEELWMEEINFRELKYHREQHANILGKLYQGQSQVIDGNTQFGRNIISNLLPKWLLVHASTMDMVLADELRQVTHVE